MTCQISSAVKTGAATVPVATDVDESKSDSENIADHTRDLGTTPGISGANKITTNWPGLADAVVTERRPDETFSEFVLRHQSRCNSASTANPIDCP